MLPFLLNSKDKSCLFLRYRSSFQYAKSVGWCLAFVSLEDLYRITLPHKIPVLGPYCLYLLELTVPGDCCWQFGRLCRLMILMICWRCCLQSLRNCLAFGINSRWNGLTVSARCENVAIWIVCLFLCTPVFDTDMSSSLFQLRNHILYLVENYQTLVIVGETGCGKSTQIPQVSVCLTWEKQVLLQGGLCERLTQQPRAALWDWNSPVWPKRREREGETGMNWDFSKRNLSFTTGKNHTPQISLCWYRQ